MDWAASPLGPVSSWSTPLRSAVGLALGSRFPITLLWGSELILLYNEAYVPVLADKHPDALGARAEDVFPEIWDTIGPMLHGVLGGGPAVWVQDAHLPLQRRGRLEEAYFTFSYSAVGGDGDVEGVITIASETTNQVIDRRRLSLLSRLGEELAAVRRPGDVADRALPLLRAEVADLPAVDIRLPGLGGGAGGASLPAAPSSALEDRDVVVEETDQGALAWLQLARLPAGEEPALLVVRLSEHLAPDETYLGFVALIAASLSQALEQVRAREARARALAAERESEARVSRLLETMSTAFYSLDHEWRFSYVNARAEKLIGCTRQDAVGHVVWDLFPAAVGTVIEDVYRTAVATGRPASFEAWYPEPLDTWFEIQAWPSDEGLAVYFVDVTERRAAQEEAERVSARAALLAAVAAELAEAQDADSAMERLPQLLVHALGDWCILTLAGEGPGHWRARLRDVGSWHADPADRQKVEAYRRTRLDGLDDDSSIARAFTGGEPTLVQHGATGAAAAMVDGSARELLAELAPEASVVLPLRGRGHTQGVLSVYRGAGRARFSDEDLSTLKEVAARAGLALDNSRVRAAQRSLAEELQRSLLTDLPRPEQLQITARYVPAADGAQIGGDWYDTFTVPDGSIRLVIGDVMGHDREAAVAMAQVRNVLRGITHALGDPPAAVLSALDRAMRDLAVGALTTAVLAEVEPDDVEPDDVESQDGSHTLRWSSAGHPPPLVLGADGRAELLTRSPDLLLGLATGTDRHDHTVTLPPGATVVLYTDGLVERRGEDLDTGLERLRHTAEHLARRGLDLDGFCDALLTELGEDAEDDVALLALHTATSTARQIPPGDVHAREQR